VVRLRTSDSAEATLRPILHAPVLTFLMEAHNALSARIVEESGFEGIWASGLGIATAMGMRDCNEASWRQVLDVVETMVDVTDIPIVLDGDSGHGNYNNVRLLVRKLCQRGVAGVCFEDKPYPKLNSFAQDSQWLAPIDEFCGKVKAAKDSQENEEFCVIARTEALVSGLGLTEALRRAHAYSDAGADAIVAHSKQSTAREVLDFGREWARRTPLWIIPTTYPGIIPQAAWRAGISTVIWANHNLRAAINAMREVSRQIKSECSSLNVEEKITTVAEVLAVFDHEELLRADRLYGGAPLGTARPTAAFDSHNSGVNRR
jgi:phosphoenolpyruvate mutase